MKTICAFMCLMSFAKLIVHVVMVIVETFFLYLFLYCLVYT